MKILLLEDNVALNRAICKIIELEKYKVDSYNDGESVLNILNCKYDLYILDINVPKISGLELLDIIYKQDNMANIIMISSNSDINSLSKAYTLGCMDYIRKPFHLEELRIKINLALQKPKQSHNELELLIKDVHVTKKEKEFLLLLLKHKNKLVNYRMIEESIYYDKSMSFDALRALVRRVRLKVKNIRIENILDEGYTLKI